MWNEKPFGILPDSMKDSTLYGIELGSITERIAKQLYPNAEITVQVYEHTNLPDRFIYPFLKITETYL